MATSGYGIGGRGSERQRYKHGKCFEERSLARVELTSEKSEWFEWEVYFEEGFEPEVRFRVERSLQSDW